MFPRLRNYLRLLAENHNHGITARLVTPFLEAASTVYSGAVALNRIGYEKKWLPRKRLPFPVVSVGNLTWGGTGKTPLVEYLARRIGEQNRTVLILTRGYGKDEVEQMRHHLPRAVIGAGADRVRIAEGIAKERKIDVAILDDGFQHWPLQRDVEIVSLNALNPFGNGKLIPRGILREPVTALSRAAIVVITHADLIAPAELEKLREKIRNAAPRAPIAESFLEPLFFYRAQKRSRVSIDRLEKQRVTTFSGVGTPRSFQLLLSRFHIKPVRNFEFSDHHPFSEQDLMEIKNVSHSASADEIVTTEKDFYRSPELITRVLNPLVLAARLRIRANEEVLTHQLMRSIGVSV